MQTIDVTLPIHPEATQIGAWVGDAAACGGLSPALQLDREAARRWRPAKESTTDPETGALQQISRIHSAAHYFGRGTNDV